MHFEDRAVETARIVQQADVTSIAQARHWITAFAAARGMAGTRQAELAMAVSEAVTNVVRHAYGEDETGEIILDAAADDEWLTVQITDHGCGAGESTSLGLGLPLMTELAERIEFGAPRDGVGTIVLMEFPLSAAAGPAHAELLKLSAATG
jgi:serine/threonine-protein kinase RsbW